MCLHPLARAFALAALVLTLTACASGQKQVCVAADGSTRCFATQGLTVRDVLQQANVSLGELDRVEPSYLAPVEDGMTIRVVRVRQQSVTETRPIPFGRRVISSPGLAAGEQRLLQGGKEGSEELTYIVTLEDGKETQRRLARQQVIASAQDEIVAIGEQGQAQAVTFAGTIAYLAQGNAWVMRGSSLAERPLVTSGDLDGRVFALSPDGHLLVFSRSSGEAGNGLNSLWAIPTDVVAAAPTALGIEDVLAGEWSPDGQTLAYSTGEKTAGSPGWRAHNDIWLWQRSAGSPPRKVRDAGCTGVYCWWGPSLTWAPDGKGLYVADASSLRYLDLDGGNERLVLEYPPFETHSSWVWVPEVAVGAGGGQLVLTVHRGTVGAPGAEAGNAFDLAVVETRSSAARVIVADAGMWARPRLGHGMSADLLAYALADSPSNSATSKYSLWIAAVDGSGARQVFPASGQAGTDITDFAWSPDGKQLVFAAGDVLYIADAAAGTATTLRTGMPATRLQWGQ